MTELEKKIIALDLKNKELFESAENLWQILMGFVLLNKQGILLSSEQIELAEGILALNKPQK
jgi:hypothetical protein